MMEIAFRWKPVSVHGLLIYDDLHRKCGNKAVSKAQSVICFPGAKALYQWPLHYDSENLRIKERLEELN